jgi:hypothetical protein
VIALAVLQFAAAAFLLLIAWILATVSFADDKPGDRFAGRVVAAACVAFAAIVITGGVVLW